MFGRRLKDIPLKGKIAKVGSVYVVRVPKQLINCGFFEVGQKVKVFRDDEDD